MAKLTSGKKIASSAKKEEGLMNDVNIGSSKLEGEMPATTILEKEGSTKPTPIEKDAIDMYY